MKNLALFRLNRWLIFTLVVTLIGCKSEGPVKSSVTETIDVTALDPHSYANFNEVHTQHLYLELEVNFTNQKIYGVARHTLINRKATKAIFDINGPVIQKVTLGPKGKEVEADFVIGKMDKDSILGQPLIVTITPSTKYVNIYYQTGDECAALEWSSQEEKDRPFVYSQGQAILTRSWIPLQDSPNVRITYQAKVTVPKGLMALMSAENPKKTNEQGLYNFSMKQPIPSYLIALTIGKYSYHSYNERCGVYADSEVLPKAAEEFSELPEMMAAAENLYGPYAWGRYDLMVQHPSFPFGGMENPRLTFVSPSIISGDKSLVSVIAHELAHSWSGNLVTNASWNDFWLNEGFTVYLEHRIMEYLKGQEYSNILCEIEFDELNQELKEIKASEHPEDARLKLNLTNRNPDDGMTSVAYVKGAYFLKTLEAKIGRTKMDAFLKGYFKKFAFQNITTETFYDYLHSQLLTVQGISFNTDEWLYLNELPKNMVKIQSKDLDTMRLLAKKTNQGENIFAPVKKFKWVEKKYKKKRQLKSFKKVYFTVQLDPKKYNTQMWQTYLRSLDSTLSTSTLNTIDESVGFSHANNEIRFEWYMVCLKNNHWAIKEGLSEFLRNIGRRKYVLPLFKELLRHPKERNWTAELYRNAKANYHSVTRKSVERLMK